MTEKKKIGVLLSGCGVYDGAEIHESVLTLLAIAEAGAEAVCMAPDKAQHHVVNHLTGQEMPETRNVLTEAARIARGDIRDLASVSAIDMDALVITGGFGAAKNLTKWAFSGPDGTIDPDVQRIVRDMVAAKRPVVGLCMGPTVIAKALEGTRTHASLSVGTTAEASPYDIAAISAGMEKAGAKAQMRTMRQVAVDTENLIISAPCYMMEGGILEVRENIRQAIDTLMPLLK